MKCRCAVWKMSGVASDGSICRREVWERYLNSPQYKDSIDNSTILGTLTHRSRNLESVPDGMGKLKGTVGRDDASLIVDSRFPAPIYKIDNIFIEGDWVYADITVFDEDMVDSVMAEQIRRFKGLIRSGVKLGVSCVLVAYWNNSAGSDICEKIHLLKGIDTTNNPSVAGAKITEVLEDEQVEKRFSEREQKKLEHGEVVVKLFSGDLGIDIPKTSKVDGKFTKLAIKEFSMYSEFTEVEAPVVPEAIVEGTEKTFSIGTVKERVRYAALSPRQQFRRLMIDYKGAIKAAGGVDKMKENDLKIMKSLFSGDVLNIIKQIYPDIMKGKQIATLIGASSISKNTRQAAQKLQIPFRLAMQQQEKQKFISKDRYQKIQEAYLEFTQAIIDEIFGPHTSALPEHPGGGSEKELDIQELSK